MVRMIGREFTTSDAAARRELARLRGLGQKRQPAMF
jgi:predicted transcriptional regulator